MDGVCQRFLALWAGGGSACAAVSCGDLDAYAEMFAEDATIEIQGYFVVVAGLEVPFRYEIEGLASGASAVFRSQIPEAGPHGLFPT